MLSWLSESGKKAAEYCRQFALEPLAKPAPLLIGGSGTGKTHLLYATAALLDTMRRAGIESVGKETIRCINEAFEKDVAVDLATVKWPTLPPPETSAGAEIAHEIRQSVGHGNLDEIVERYRQEDAALRGVRAVFFIDDVEVMKMSDWLHEELYRIFDFRYQHEMPTPMATNLNPEELKQHLGDRITRRILDMTEPFILES